MRTLGIKTVKAYKEYCKSGKKPEDIPYNPDREYKNKGWKSWGDFLDTGNISQRQHYYKPFEQARDFVRKLGLETYGEWRRYCKSKEKPWDIPSKPEDYYKNKGWTDFGDWLGTTYLSFEQARDFVRKLGLKNQKQWRRYCKSKEKPITILSNPDKTYKTKGWTDFGDWLGTNTIAPQKRNFLPFEQARDFVRKLGLKSVAEYENYHKTNKPKQIPYSPQRYYKDKDWKGWGDFLGTGTIAPQYTGWSIEKVKELLRFMIETKIIYEWSEARLYKFLLTKGVLNLTNTNKHINFFKNLITTVKKDEGRKIIEEYAYSESKDIPDLSNTSLGNVEDDEIPIASNEELANLVNDKANPLDYKEPSSVEQIFSSISILESINVDEEAMQFFLRGSINDLWKNAFIYKENTVLAVQREGMNGHNYHDTVAQTFLSEYQNTHELKIPEGYSSNLIPTLMQKFVAYKINTFPYFGNFSGTGAGKTLSAILASRIIDSKMTVIVCPNDIVSQWENEVKRMFSNSYTFTGKKAFSTLRDSRKYQYIILNYDKFNQNLFN